MSFGIPTRSGLGLGLPSVMALTSSFPYEGLITPGIISPDLTFTRAQADGAVATAAGLSAWQTYAADEPRFVTPYGGLLNEGQRTNGITNPREPGGTGWTLTNIASVTAIAGPDGVVNNASTINEGTANGTHIIVATIPSVYTTAHTLSVLLRPGTCNRARVLFGGSGFGNTVSVSVLLTGAGAITATGAGVTNSSITAVNGWYRVQVSGLSLASGSTQVQFRMLSSTGSEGYTGTNRTLDVAWPQSEVSAAFASTPILPPIGTPDASTRGADLLSAPLASVDVSDDGACTVLWSGQFVGLDTTSTQRLIAVDDGTTDNCVGFEQQSGTSLQVFRTTAGASATDTAATSAAVGAPLRIGVSIDGAGRVAASVNGDVPVAVTGAPTSGLTTIRFGNDASGTAPMFGTMAYCVVLPFALSDADLQAAVSAFPVP
jgi:hypothetical protein